MRKIGLGKGNQESCCEHVKISVIYSSVRFFFSAVRYMSLGLRGEVRIRDNTFWQH